MDICYVLTMPDRTTPMLNVAGIHSLPRIGEKITIVNDNIRSKFQITDIEYLHLHSWKNEAEISNTRTIVHAKSI